MHIVHIAAEIAPVAKIGGLADVVSGLSNKQSEMGHNVRTFLPKYDCLQPDVFSVLEPLKDFQSYYFGQWHHNTLWEGKLHNGGRLLLIEPHLPIHYFKRGTIYGCSDDIDRFLYFCRAVLDWMRQENTCPDVIHLHDWQTACIAPLMRSPSFKKIFENTGCVISLHNLEHQGRCATWDLDKVSLNSQDYSYHSGLADNFHPCLNLLKGGITYSDIVVTVSPTYSKEATTPEGGKGLHQSLIDKGENFKGILNGIDTGYWNPATDPHLAYPYAYSPKDQGKTCFELKQKNKEELCCTLGLELNPQAPFVASILRLVRQKGTHLIRHAIEKVLERGGLFVILGSSPDSENGPTFYELREKYTHHPRVRIVIDHNEPLAHHIYAAADMFIVPSLFEPCGLTQMISMRYGAVPIVRRTGGLADTVFDIETSGLPFKKTNGFTFDFPDNQGVDYALDRALDLWYTDTNTWHQLRSQVMQIDHSWDRSVNDYLNIYNQALSSRSLVSKI